MRADCTKASRTTIQRHAQLAAAIEMGEVSKQSVGAAEQLSSQAEEMLDMVGAFKLRHKGQGRYLSRP